MRLPHGCSNDRAIPDERPNWRQPLLAKYWHQVLYRKIPGSGGSTATRRHHDSKILHLSWRLTTSSYIPKKLNTWRSQYIRCKENWSWQQSHMYHVRSGGALWVWHIWRICGLPCISQIAIMHQEPGCAVRLEPRCGAARAENARGRRWSLRTDAEKLARIRVVIRATKIERSCQMMTYVLRECHF